ncbi:uncharacterized protein irgq1 [Electrophorus electricus]|nr:uncharacterized protein irgq1 [Electrophorus electricus]XP_026871689.2 uncharacterized protein irgq1 [Electrophorus electricus]
MDTRFSMPQKVPEECITKITEALQSVKSMKTTREFMTVLEVFSQFKMDIAVTGESGSGKSTLINALLGLDHDDEGAASTGVVETTSEPAMYQYPNLPYVRLWDLPGMGTPSFASKTYVEAMNFVLYDMFIVVISERFRENNMLVIDEIQRQNKPFYIVRTKVDNDLLSQSRKLAFTETRALGLMRDECLKYLNDKNLHPSVFLVSVHGTQKYDLQKLKDTLENEASKLKIEVFPLFMANVFTKGRTKARTIQQHALQSGKISEEDLQKICTICKHSDFAHGTEALKTVLDALEHFQLDVAILGETGSGVSTLLDALSGKQNSTNSTTSATSLQYPDVRFWAVSGIERITDNLEDIKLFMDNFDFFVIIVSEWQQALHVELARAADQLRKHYHFVQTKVDCYLQTQGDLCYPEIQLLDGLRAQSAEELKKANLAHSQLFLINGLDKNTFDFVSLECVLSSDLNAIRLSAFAYWVDGMVRQKQNYSTCQIL